MDRCLQSWVFNWTEKNINHVTNTITAQKMKFPIKGFFSKCGQIRRKMQIWSHLLKKSLMENFIFYAVNPSQNVLKRSKGVTWEYNKEQSKKHKEKEKMFKIRFKMTLVVIVDYYWLFYVQFVSFLFLVLAKYSMPSFPNAPCTISKCFCIY